MKGFVFFVVALCGLQTLQAAILTLSEVQREVVKNLPLIKQYEQKVKEKEAEFQVSRGAFDTKIRLETQSRFDDFYKNNFSDVGVYQNTSLLGLELFAGRRLGRGRYPIYDEKFQTSRLGEAYIGAVFPLLRNMLIDTPRYSRSLAQFEWNSEKEEFKLKSLEQLNIASKRYWNWMLATRILKIHRDLLMLANKRQKIYVQRSQMGDLEKIKLTDNLRLISKRQADYNQSFQSFTQSTLDLQLYLDTNTSIEESNAPLDWLYEKNIFRSSKNDISEFKKKWPVFSKLNIERKKIHLDYEFYSHQRWPLLNLKVEGVRDVGGGSPVDTHPDDLRVGLFFEYPLENNMVRGELNKVRSQRIAFEANYDWINKQYEIQMSQIISLLKQTEELISKRKNEVESTIKMREAEVVRVEKGASDLYILNLREEDEAIAKINLNAAIHSYHHLIMDYEMLTGKWLDKLQSQ